MEEKQEIKLQIFQIISVNRGKSRHIIHSIGIISLYMLEHGKHNLIMSAFDYLLNITYNIISVNVN